MIDNANYRPAVSCVSHRAPVAADESLAVWITIYTHYLFPGRWPPGVGTRTRHILILEIFLFSSVFATPLTAGHWWSLNMSDPATFCHAPLPFYWKPQVTCAKQQRSGAVTTGQGRCGQIFYFVCTVQSMDQVEVGHKYTYQLKKPPSLWLLCGCHHHHEVSVMPGLQLGHTPSCHGPVSRALASWCCCWRRWCRSRRDTDGAICPPHWQLSVSGTWHRRSVSYFMNVFCMLLCGLAEEV